MYMYTIKENNRLLQCNSFHDLLVSCQRCLSAFKMWFLYFQLKIRSKTSSNGQTLLYSNEETFLQAQKYI